MDMTNIPDKLPFMPNKAELKRLLESRIDPDAERFRYMAAVLLDLDTNKVAVMAGVMELREPKTVDDLRACIDAAMRLMP